MKKGLLDYLCEQTKPSEHKASTLETTIVSTDSTETCIETIAHEDKIFITSICSSYIQSYESGELTFEKTVKLAWTFLDDYEEQTTDTDAFYAYKSEILYELLAHLVTLKPEKGATKRTALGTPPPKLRQKIPVLVDGLIARNNSLRKLPVDTDIADCDSLSYVGNNVFEATAEKLQKWGFPKTTAKMVYDTYYDKSSNSQTSVKSS